MVDVKLCHVTLFLNAVGGRAARGFLCVAIPRTAHVGQHYVDPRRMHI